MLKSLDIERVARTHWDAVVVGGGHGGGTLAFLLAQKGHKVLLCEQKSQASSKFIYTANGRREVAMLGTGPGGSSRWYGMAMQRFRDWEFNSSLRDDDIGQSLPTWPLDASTLSKHYDLMEKLYRVRSDNLPELSPPNCEIVQHLEGQQIRCDRLPMACEFVEGCEECQAQLCPKKCKNDVFKICIEPAIKNFGVQVLTDGCAESLILQGSSALGLNVASHDRSVPLRASRIFLCAGALGSPQILKRSHIENPWIGRFLMRHFIDLAVVESKSLFTSGDLKKQIRFDLYDSGRTPIAHVQSFGPAPAIDQLEDKLVRMFPRWLSSLRIPQWLARTVHKKIHNKVILALILEDEPQAHNGLFMNASGQFEVKYKMSQADWHRIKTARQRLKKILSPYRVSFLKSAHNMEMIAHACGTCRMGLEPSSSVVDENLKVHGFDNLFVVDGSVFPTSGAINPALTIAALASFVAGNH